MKPKYSRAAAIDLSKYSLEGLQDSDMYASNIFQLLSSVLCW